MTYANDEVAQQVLPRYLLASQLAATAVGYTGYSSAMPSPAPAIILFDGVCNLCHGFVQFVIRHDSQAQFCFAALQSEAGQALLAAQGQQALGVEADPDSVLLLEGGKLYSHSTAVLRIAGRLGGVWRLLAVGWLLPRPWRDALYRFVARHRYRWFGRQNSCMLPTPALKARFL